MARHPHIRRGHPLADHDYRECLGRCLTVRAQRANCLVVRTRRRVAVLPAAAAYRASGLDATRGPGIADKQQGMGISIT